jgi:hypothetical protein
MVARIEKRLSKIKPIDPMRGGTGGGGSRGGGRHSGFLSKAIDDANRDLPKLRSALANVGKMSTTELRKVSSGASNMINSLKTLSKHASASQRVAAQSLAREYAEANRQIISGTKSRLREVEKFQRESDSSNRTGS